jgi:leucyl/phenylalanyl-tRNA---protein transferase
LHGPALTPQMLLAAYAQGLFPMAERRDDPTLYWVSPQMRGILPLDRFHLPRRLARTIRSGRFSVSFDRAFGAVMEECASPRPGREQSWINSEITRLYGALAASGHAHSVECWRDGKLAGGLYGVKLGAAFFGESMFAAERDASKVALACLVEALRRGGFQLLDTQFLTPHLAGFGAIEIAQQDYLGLLRDAIRHDAVWPTEV